MKGEAKNGKRPFYGHSYVCNHTHAQYVAPHIKTNKSIVYEEGSATPHTRTLTNPCIHYTVHIHVYVCECAHSLHHFMVKKCVRHKKANEMEQSAEETWKCQQKNEEIIKNEERKPQKKTMRALKLKVNELNHQVRQSKNSSELNGCGKAVEELFGVCGTLISQCNDVKAIKYQHAGTYATATTTTTTTTK